MVVLLLAGCAGSTTATAGPRSTSGPPVATRTFGVAADGRSVTVRVGDVLAVRLPPPNATQNWDRLTASDPGVVAVRSSRGGYPGRAPLVATVVAGKAGRSRLSTQSDQSCLHTTPRCLPPQVGWSMTVTVR